MSQFVFVASEISNERFEAAMEVKIKSGNAVKFLPQGNPQHNGGVISPGMSSARIPPSAPELLHNVRFEWDLNGAEFGAEIVRVLAGRRKQEAQPSESAA